MPGTFTKSILKVGTYHSPDGVVEVTPERLRHWERECAKLQSVGYALPSHFDHSNDIDLLEPIAMDVLERKHNRSAQATVGKLDSFRVAPDGNSAEIVINTLTPDATRVVESNAVYVSPVIFPEWKDGAGNQYRDVITSFDLVDHPVDYSQSSFLPAVKMGLKVCPAIRMGLGKPLYRKPSRSENLPMPKRKRSQQARKERFRAALRKGLMRMGSDYDPDDDDMKEMAEDSPANDPPTADETPTPSDDPSPTEEIEVGPSDAPDLLDSVLNLLHEFGVALPDDTTDANLISHLRVALTALLNAEANDDDDIEELGDDLPSEMQGQMPEATAPNIATMSVQQRKQLERAQVLERKLQQQQRDSTKAQLDGLLKTGRCTSAEHDKFARQLGTVRMSLNDDGEFKETRVDYFIQDRLTLPAGAYWTDQQRTANAQKLSVVEPPKEWTGGGGRSTDDFEAAIKALGGRV